MSAVETVIASWDTPCGSEERTRVNSRDRVFAKWRKRERVGEASDRIVFAKGIKVYVRFQFLISLSHKTGGCHKRGESEH